MARYAGVFVRPQDGMSCARDDRCFNPKNGSLTPDDFRLRETSTSGKLYRDKTCIVCRRKLDRELKRQRDYNKRRADGLIEPRKIKPFDWSQFDGLAWDVRAANDVLKRLVISL
jgi:hypothetical protein